MKKNSSSEAIDFELSAEESNGLDKAIENHRASVRLSVSSRIGFHEKLVVISASSLTLAATLAASVFVKFGMEKCMMHRLLILLAASCVLFFLSLIASLIHNFLETEALHTEAESEYEGTKLKITLTAIKKAYDNSLPHQAWLKAAKLIVVPLEVAQATKAQKAERFRICERWLGILAIVAFVLGYTPAIVFVFSLAMI